MLNPGQTIDRYTIEAVIGHGGTAVVYLARHNQLDSQHALKVLSLTSNAIRERLLREGRVQAALQHPNIVTVTDVLDVDGDPGLLMEYIDGPSLDQAARRYKIGLDDALTLFRGVVAGVRAAHRQGLVHRDLKPANVLLYRSPEGFVPKVTDFGLAKLLGGAGPELGQTRQGIAMGTPAYMAPEQIRDARAVDQRADIFSLGCILYELVTRQRAFPGTQALEIYNDIVAGRYTPPEDLVPDLPDAVIQAIDGSLIRDREQRIPDCETLLEVLAGRRTWAIVDHPVPDDVMSTEEVARDAPSMPVAARKGTPAPAPPRDASGPPTGVDGSLVETTFSDRRARVGRRSLVLAGLLLVAPLLLLLVLFVIGLGWAFRENQRAAELQVQPEPVSLVVEAPPSAPPPPSDGAPAVVPDASPAPSVSAGSRPAAGSGSASSVAADPAPDPASVAAVSPASTQPERISVQAEVRIFSDPKTVAISIDGRDVGRTPRKLTLAPGSYRVRVASGEQVGDFAIRVESDGDNTWCYSFPEGRAAPGKCP